MLHLVFGVQLSKVSARQAVFDHYIMATLGLVLCCQFDDDLPVKLIQVKFDFVLEFSRGVRRASAAKKRV